MFSHVEQALVHLSAALDGIEAAPSDQLRRTLALSKQLRSRVELLETKAAAAVARREHHGDGGAGLLREHSGLSRSDAARNVRTGAELAAIPDADAAVAQGQISLANAATLARAARTTSPGAVQGDRELIGLAKALPADEFAHAARRWEAQHQDAADLAALHRGNRRNRHVRFWNGDDGSVQMRGSFDAETGARIQQRLRRQAERLRQADRRHQAQHPNRPDPHNHSDSGAAGPTTDQRTTDQRTTDQRTTDQRTTDQRTTDQRMADALDTLLAAAAPTQPASQQPHTNHPPQPGPLTPPDTHPTAPDCDEPASQQPQADPLAPAGPETTRPGRNGEADGTGRLGPVPPAAAPPPIAPPPTAPPSTAPPSIAPPSTAPPSIAPPLGAPPPLAPVGRKAAAEIIVRADLAALTDQPGGLAEICGIGPIPPSTLARLACNSDVWVEIFGDTLTPLFETVASRAPTAAQRRALIARDGACIGCGKPPGDCEAHHVIPCNCGGKTRVDNLVLVCWSCHDRIHDHNWHIVVRDSRYRLMPPDPAQPPNPAPSRKPKHPTPPPTPPAATPQLLLPSAAPPHQPAPAAENLSWNLS